MIYKIPIYIEVKTEGNFDPSLLSEAIDRVMPDKILKTIKDYGGFPFDSKNDILDLTAERVRSLSKTKRIRITIVPNSTVLQKIVHRDKL